MKDSGSACALRIVVGVAAEYAPKFLFGSEIVSEMPNFLVYSSNGNCENVPEVESQVGT